MNKTNLRLASTFLGYFILIIILLTLNPFYFETPHNFRVATKFKLEGFILNIVLFMPIGFLYRLVTNKRGAFLFGALISICIEITQFFVPVRTTSAIDLLANSLGAGISAIIHDAIITRITLNQETVGRLRLETPLMGFLYALTPLLFIDSLSIDSSLHRWTLMFLLGLCGAIVTSEISYHWKEKIDIQIISYASLGIGVWFFIGIIGAIQQLWHLLPIILGVVFITAILVAIHKPTKDRRYERNALQKILPIFIFYIFLLAIRHPIQFLTDWHWSIGFTNSTTEDEYFALIHGIEYLTAFTVFGYLIAEWFGRAELTLVESLPKLVLSSAGVGLILEFIVGFQAEQGASLLRLILVIACAIFGGIMYHQMRDHIRFLLKK